MTYILFILTIYIVYKFTKKVIEYKHNQKQEEDFWNNMDNLGN